MDKIDPLNLTTLELWPLNARKIIEGKRISIEKINKKFCEVIYPWDNNYDQQRQLFSSQIQQKPLMIIFPISNEEVIILYSLMKHFNLSIRIISGRHSPLLAQPDIFVSMDNFRQIYLNKHVLTVGSYYTQGQVNDFLFTHKPKHSMIYNNKIIQSSYYLSGTRSNYPNLITPMFPGGSAGTVGAIGISLSGGVGTLRRTYGLTIDSILEFKIVIPPTLTSKPKIIIAKKDNNEDLFWALRGGGNQTLGFVTEIKYHIDIVPAVILYEIDWIYTEENVINVLDQWQHNSVKLSNQFNEDLSFITSTLDYSSSNVDKLPEQAINITGVYVLNFGQSAEDAIEDVRRNTAYLLNIGGKIEINSPNSYANVYTKFVETRSFHNFSLGRAIFTRKHVTANVIIERMREALKFKARTLIGLQLMGGAISNIKSTETAFYPRKAKFFIDIFNYWDSCAEQTNVETWNSETFKIILESNGPFCYIGFPVAGLTPFNYYGKNSKRLSKLKEKYDPLGLLNV